MEECHCYTFVKLAGMAELADALDLGSSAARRAGSSPVPGTRFIGFLVLQSAAADCGPDRHSVVTSASAAIFGRLR